LSCRFNYAWNSFEQSNLYFLRKVNLN
jgi:hypothetical protein